MPPRAPRSKTPQNKTSMPKHKLKTTPENDVKGQTQEILDMKKESVDAAQELEEQSEDDLKEYKAEMLRKLAQEKDLLLANAIAELGLDETEEGEEEESVEDLPFNITEHPSGFIKCDTTEEEEEEEVFPQEQIVEDDPFLNTFGGVPELDDLSEDESVKEEVQVKQRKSLLGTADIGMFVNPLSGYISLPPADELPVDNIERMSVQSEAEEQKRPSRRRSTRPSTRDSTDDVEAVDEYESDEAHKDDDNENLLELLELEAQKQQAELALEGAAVEDLLRQQMQRVNYEQTLDFLNTLINACVDKAEYTDENVILRKSLDKKKLMVALRTKLKEVEIERKRSQFLNRKCSDFFRRRSAFSKLIPDNSAANRQKYREVLKNLDGWLKKEEKFKKESAVLLKECMKEYKNINKSLENGVQQLEQLIKSTFHREKFARLREIVFQNIEHMSTIRKEISEDRTKLLILQHDATILRQRLTKLEDLGNGLYLKDYETLERQAATLDKKMEERKSNLKKIYSQLNSEIHNLAHLKEKQKMTRQFIGIQKQILNELQVEKQKLRKFITELKISKIRYRYEIRQKSFQCGLLDKPVLMRDYDRTEILIRNLRISNDDLKKKADDMIKKIAQLEDKNQKKNREDSNENPQNIS